MKIFKNLKKLNNKGMTLLELLVCFIVVSSVVISMFNLIMHYQTDEYIESVKSDVIDYKNNITKIIQNDIIKHELKAVHLQTSGDENPTYMFTLIFKSPFFDNHYTKNLVIHTSDTVASENYILYDDKINDEMKPVKYALPNTGDNTITKFSAIETNINGSEEEGWGTNRIDPITKTNIGTTFFDLNIVIGNNNLGGNYSVKIIAPLNYSYCHATT